jgi:hypothetical protein
MNSQDSGERVKAAKTAVTYPYKSEEDRRAVLEMLVTRLDDDDEAVRFFSILALEKMTGSRRGYEYHAPWADRLRAVQTWRRYLSQLAAGTGAPTSRPGDTDATHPAAAARTTSSNGSPGSAIQGSSRNGAGGSQ